MTVKIISPLQISDSVMNGWNWAIQQDGTFGVLGIRQRISHLSSGGSHHPGRLVFIFPQLGRRKHVNVILAQDRL